MLTDTPTMTEAPEISTDNAAQNETVTRTTMTWTVSFQHVFDVARPMTRDEFVELAKTHIEEMRKQFPELLKSYPQEFLKEMQKNNLLNVATFRTNGNNGNES